MKSFFERVFLCMLLLVLCFNLGHAEGAVKYKPGEYTAKATGFGGYVTVTVTIDDQGAISDVKIQGDMETPDLGGIVVEDFPALILKAQSADIDTYSGATLTSKAVISATQDILSQAQK